jgi:hypothetical protein
MRNQEALWSAISSRRTDWLTKELESQCSIFFIIVMQDCDQPRKMRRRLIEFTNALRQLPHRS